MPFQPGNKLGGRRPLSKAQKLAQRARRQMQPELVEILGSIARDLDADRKDRIAAAKALLDEQPKEVNVQGQITRPLEGVPTEAVLAGALQAK